MANSSNIYMKLSGITGEGQDAGHKDWVDIDSYSQGLSNASSSGYGGGSGVGRVQYGELNIVCHMEKAVPILMQYCATGKHIDEVKLEACKSTGGTKIEAYFTITLTKAYVSSVNFGGHDNSKPTVNISLTCEKIKTEYKPQKSDGSLDAAIPATYDIKAGQSS
ncbi:MAG: type VI secretion system tube protein Hcp [Burkholderiales bacterium]|nr:type VI secretion system tube protein Hcp [Burkholderiales bacterium]